MAVPGDMNWASPAVWTVIAGVLSLLIFISWFKFGSFSSKELSDGIPTVLLTGPAGSGKTALYLRWAGYEGFPRTVPSSKPNKATTNLFGDGKVALVDLPGHDKLQHFTIDALQQHKRPLAVVYVLDAASGTHAIEAAAHGLYRILEYAEQRGVRVLVAANKLDLFSALGPAKIRRLLEYQITELRETRSRALGEAGNDESGEVDTPWLGLDTPAFRFEDLETPVEVLDGSVKQRRTQKWEEWIGSDG